MTPDQIEKSATSEQPTLVAYNQLTSVTRSLYRAVSRPDGQSVQRATTDKIASQIEDTVVPLIFLNPEGIANVEIPLFPLFDRVIMEGNSTGRLMQDIARQISEGEGRSFKKPIEGYDTLQEEHTIHPTKLHPDLFLWEVRIHRTLRYTIVGTQGLPEEYTNPRETERRQWIDPNDEPYLY